MIKWIYIITIFLMLLVANFRFADVTFEFSLGTFIKVIMLALFLTLSVVFLSAMDEKNNKRKNKLTTHK